MACGEFGPGRMAEPPAIVAAIAAALGAGGADAAATCSSPPARRTSRSTRCATSPTAPRGRQGYAIAEALAAARRARHLRHRPGRRCRGRPASRVVEVETAREMLAAVEAALPADVAVFVAAVADWRVADARGEQDEEGPGAAPPALTLAENPDILRTVAARNQRPAAAGGRLRRRDRRRRSTNAVAKRQRKGCDWIVANDVSPATGVMGGDRRTR